MVDTPANIQTGTGITDITADWSPIQSKDVLVQMTEAELVALINEDAGKDNPRANSDDLHYWRYLDELGLIGGTDIDTGNGTGASPYDPARSTIYSRDEVLRFHTFEEVEAAAGKGLVAALDVTAWENAHIAEGELTTRQKELLAEQALDVSTGVDPGAGGSQGEWGEMQEAFDLQDYMGTFGRFMQHQTGFRDLPGTTQRMIRSRATPMFREFQVSRPGFFNPDDVSLKGGNPFYEFLKGGERPSGEDISGNLSRIFDLIRDQTAADPSQEAGQFELGARELFDPGMSTNPQVAAANQQWAGMMPILRGVGARMRQGMFGVARNLFERERNADPNLQFFEFARRRGWM